LLAQSPFALAFVVESAIGRAHGGDIEVGRLEEGAAFTLRLRGAEGEGRAP
jgi:hypothetical protein